jgi:uncharacterized protein
LPADLDVLRNGARKAPMTIALAHGAGAGMDTPFMDYFAKQIAQGGFRVIRFEFPYMATYRKTGTARPRARAARNVAAYHREGGAEEPGDRRQVNGRPDCQLDRR